MGDKFNPKEHLRVFGKQGEYLETKWRLVWLREAQPDSSIETEIVEHNYQEGFALFRARVTIPSGGSATGWGSETRQDFRDYLEKAETKALGRALAALGFGTAFAAEMDEGGSVADAPVERKQEPVKAAPTLSRTEPDTATTEAVKTPLPIHVKALWAAKTENKWSDAQLKALMQRQFRVESTRDLTEEQAGWLRSAMQRARVAASKMDTTWDGDTIASRLAEAGVATVLEMDDVELEALENDLKAAGREIGRPVAPSLVEQLAGATR